MNRRFCNTCRFLALIFVMSCLGPNGSADEPATKARSPLAELKSEYEAATKEWESKYSGKRTDPSEELIKRYDSWPGWSFIPRIVKLGTADPATPDSFESLKWFVDLSRAVGAADKEYYPFDEPVMKALRTRHIANPRIVEVFKDCSRYATPGREALLRECVEKGSTRDVRGLACLNLADYLREKSTAPSSLLQAELGIADEFQRHFKGRSSPEFLAFVRSIDSDKAAAEAKSVEQRVIDEFGDVPHPEQSLFSMKPTLGFVVRLRRARDVATKIGQPAPELVGEDLDGKERKLSDYQGKVVVLHFWATWCGPCVEKIPQLVRIAERQEKEPLCVLGVNFDPEREAAVKFVKEKKISWPSWWSLAQGESMGHWFVDGNVALTVMVIDHKGVLRYHGVEGEALDKAVDSLLRERAEDASRK